MLARFWDKGLAAIVATSYVTIVIVGFAQVLFRFAFHISLAWSEEVVRYVFIWSVFFTAALAFNLDTHIVIDFLTTWYPPRLKRVAALISWVCVIGGLIILLVLGIQLIQAPFGPVSEIPGDGNPDGSSVRGHSYRQRPDAGQCPTGSVAHLERGASRAVHVEAA